MAVSEWLNQNLEREVKRIFEPRYKRRLSDEEIVEIVENLTGAMEGILKFKWRQKNENTL